MHSTIIRTTFNQHQLQLEEGGGSWEERAATLSLLLYPLLIHSLFPVAFPAPSSFPSSPLLSLPPLFFLYLFSSFSTSPLLSLPPSFPTMILLSFSLLLHLAFFSHSVTFSRSTFLILYPLSLPLSQSLHYLSPPSSHISNTFISLLFLVTHTAGQQTSAFLTLGPSSIFPSPCYPLHFALNLLALCPSLLSSPLVSLVSSHSHSISVSIKWRCLVRFSINLDV